MTVYELNPSQLDDLKMYYFYSKETCHLIPDDIDFYEELPDSVIQKHFENTNFETFDFSSFFYKDWNL